MVAVNSTAREFVRKTNGLLSIGEASRILGVSQQTMRSAADNGSLRAFVLPSGHRRFALDDCYAWLGQGGENPAAKELKTIVYARVSGGKQAKGIAKGEESDLTRQIQRLTAYCAENFGCYFAD
jgi:excisionase family DNA binding protein